MGELLPFATQIQALVSALGSLGPLQRFSVAQGLPFSVFSTLLLFCPSIQSSALT